jgi:ribosomal protein L16 Arg81 hydroxylase
MGGNLAPQSNKEGGDRSVTTSRFLENLTLGSLVSPFPEEDFRTRYWDQKPLIVQRGDPGFYGDLFTLKDFDAAIAGAPDHVNTANAAANKKGVINRAATVRGIERVLADMRDGHTLMLDRLNERDPKLGLFCRLLGPQLGSSFQTNLYLTPAHGQGYLPHWDNHDVFVLQVVGSKRWKIEKTRRTVPGLGEKMGEGGRELRGEIHSVLLEQGDLIYIPRGFVHAAECGAVPSLHITFGIRPFFLEELLAVAIKSAVRRDARWRAALPIGFMHGEREQVVRRAMVALREITDERFLGAVVDQFRKELVETFPLDVSGQVLDFFQPAPIGLGDSVGPRRGMVYQINVEGDSARLNYGARNIIFPSHLQEALNFCLKTPTFAVRDVPGELQDEERRALIERLMQEGLLVRMPQGAAFLEARGANIGAHG